MSAKTRLLVGLLCFNFGIPFGADAQTATNLAVLKGLAPLTILRNSNPGKAALAANFSVTGGIQTGVLRQSTLLPFEDQQQQALKDAFISSGNLTQLAHLRHRVFSQKSVAGGGLSGRRVSRHGNDDMIESEAMPRACHGDGRNYRFFASDRGWLEMARLDLGTA